MLKLCPSVGLWVPQSSAAAEFAVDAADFDGTNDYMTRGAGLSGASDATKGILSVWVRLDGGDATIRTILYGTNARMLARIFSNDTVQLFATDSADGQVLGVDSVSTLTAGASWRHILASWDCSSPAFTAAIYIDDVSDHSLTVASGTIDYTLADWAIGAALDTTEKFDGAIADLYFDQGTYMDFSIEANRRKFRTAAGKPADLGSDGSTPTGSAPISYHHLDDGEAVANFATNRGSGGNFTITGTLATASSSPSD